MQVIRYSVEQSFDAYSWQTVERKARLIAQVMRGRVDVRERPPTPHGRRSMAARSGRRRRGGRRLPPAGAEVVVRPSPWQLGLGQETLPADLTAEWLAGWLAAAREQEPDLTAVTAPYQQRRTAEAADGRLSVTVHHRTCWPCHDERRCVDPRAAG
jgi:hypothetical protein